MHTGVLPHRCKYCRPKFVNATVLVRQKVLEHVAEKTLKWDVCSKIFGRNINFIEHKRRILGDHTFKCEISGNCFSSISGMKTH